MRLLILSALAALLPASANYAITAEALEQRLQAAERIIIVDIRPSVAYERAHIPGAISIPLHLLTYKRIPSGVPVFAYGDGLGEIPDTAILEKIQTVSATADVLEGGFASWVEHTGVTTGLPGVTREHLPGITYDQLLETDRADIVLIDVRKREATTKSVPGVASPMGQTDPLEAFAQEHGLPLQRGLGSSALSSETTVGTLAASSEPAGPTAREEVDPLFVLVASNEREANHAARKLRASGIHRFTILIGGTEAIVHEGRTGTGRQGGQLPVISSPPSAN